MADDAIINAAAETVQDGLAGPLSDRDSQPSTAPVASTNFLPQDIANARNSGQARGRNGLCRPARCWKM
jgi:hypothetical protein